MKPKFKRMTVALAAVFAFSGVLAGCKEKSAFDSETDSVIMALQGCDGMFNPFFATSEYDSEVVGMTQIGMLSSDSKGNITYGDDEAVVTKDFTTVMTDRNGNVVTDGNQAAYTEFSFLIKNGIKFSDGEPLTIKDVLFSLYVYLDPAYTGSTTIYSTDIVGLAAYRTQNPQADENAAEQLEQMFAQDANDRLQDIYDYCQNKLNDAAGNSEDNVPLVDAARAESDLATVAEFFEEELGRVYQSAEEGLEDTMREYTFISEEYQAFFLSEGLITLMDADNNGVTDKDDDGKYIVDEASAEYYCELVESYADANYSNYEGTSTDEKKAAAKKDRAIEIVFSDYFGEDGKTYNYSRIQEVVAYRETAVNLITEFTADARSEYLAGERRVQNISGITTDRVTEFNGKKLDGTYDVLKIKINGADPKAKWNFGFNVSPLHYYSTHSYNGKDYIAAFDGVTEFGLEFGSKEFMDAVVNSVDKNDIPVGAGPYKASRESGTEGMTEKYVSATEFRRNNIIYFERNTNFESLGGSIHNAKIKYLRYQVINSNQIFNTLQRGSIDFGELTAKASVIEDLNNSDSLGYSLTDANGYGYVGVNAKYVPDVNVRRAIMMAMDPTLITSNYYTNGLAQVIYRPMSKVSWAYPDGAEPYYTYDNSGDKILQMLLDAGYTQRNAGTDDVQLGKVENGKFTQLKYTFTISGSTEDHPAWSMFKKAEEILDGIGFDITVRNDAFALSKLSSGLLTVWAAAWSSTIDPDMYQVYHKDSTATSTLNWGYDVIKANLNGTYTYEKGLVEELSALIDDARETEDQPRRESIYSDALDLVMELAIEFPLYQRKELMAFNSSKIDRNTLTPESELSPYNSLLSRIWEMDFVK